MINGKRWYAFFSHTGTEIVIISKQLNISPDCIITNKAPGDGEINKGISKLKSELKFVTNTNSHTDKYSCLHQR